MSPKFSLLENNEGMLFNQLLIAGLIIIVIFALFNIGSYINGAISINLVETLPDNTPSGTVDLNYWHNATTDSYRNISLPCTVGELDTTNSKFYILANGSSIFYNLTTNGHQTNDTSALTKGIGYNHTFADLIENANLTNSDTYVNFTWDVNNSGNRINIVVTGTYYKDGDYRTAIENRTYMTLTDLSAGYDNTIDVIIIATIIMAITLPLAAVIAIKKLL